MSAGLPAYVYGEEGDGWFTPSATSCSKPTVSGRRRAERDRPSSDSAPISMPMTRRWAGEPRARTGPQRTRPRPGARRGLRRSQLRRGPVDAPLRELARLVASRQPAAREGEGVDARRTRRAPGRGSRTGARRGARARRLAARVAELERRATQAPEDAAHGGDRARSTNGVDGGPARGKVPSTEGSPIRDSAPMVVSRHNDEPRAQRPSSS